MRPKKIILNLVSQVKISKYIMTGRHFILKTTQFFLNLTYNGENEPFPILIHQ